MLDERINLIQSYLEHVKRNINSIHCRGKVLFNLLIWMDVIPKITHFFAEILNILSKNIYLMCNINKTTQLPRC